MAIISGLFLASSLTVIITPGPDAALITRLVLAAGRRLPALLAGAGMISAGAVQAGLSVAGVSLLLRADSTLLRAVQWAGVALLASFGVRALLAAGRRRARPDAQARQPAGEQAGGPGGRAAPAWGGRFAQGFLCTGTNPKVGLFLLAFLPQFVPGGVPAGHAMTILAVVYLCMGATWLVTLTELVLRFRRLARRRGPGGSAILLRCVDAAMGVVFLSFAVRLALGG